MSEKSTSLANEDVRALIKSQPLLVQAIILVESAGNPLAVSETGAKGLMQLMPNTIKVFKVTDPFDPKENIRGGTSLLREELDRFMDSLLALAAYNAGSPAVFKAMRTAQSRSFEKLSPWLPKQTREYVPKILQALVKLAAEKI